MNPEQVVEEIRRRRERRREVSALNLYWITLSGNRDEFKYALQQVRGESPIVPWILRKSGLFRDSNAVMNDVMAILNNVRPEIGDVAESARRQDGVDLVVIARDELRLAVTSSPILLPDWFPLMPEQTVMARIDDLTWAVNVAMSDDVVALDELRRILYDLDGLMVARIRETREKDHRRVQAFWELIRQEEEDNLGQILDTIGKSLDELKNPAGFRPSTQKNPTIVGRLWFEANRISPDKLPRLSKALASALQVDDLDISDREASLAGVLSRPTNPIGDSGTRWCFHLLVTLRSACQLVTAAAHADDYPLFPDVLLRSVSRDLREFLDGAIQVLKAIPPPSIS